jgi:hypothetical protein
MAFASQMAFAEGGIVPGVEMGDTVPALLTPGEAVLPKDLTERLSNAARFGNSDGGGGDVHVHVHHSPTIHALDSQGRERVLEQHADLISRKTANHFRKMNR